MEKLTVVDEHSLQVQAGQILKDYKGREAKFIRVASVGAAGYKIEVKRSHALYTEMHYAAAFNVQIIRR